MVAFVTFAVVIFQDSFNPIYKTKSSIVNSKRLNIEGHIITDINVTSEDKCRDGYEPLFKHLITGKTRTYCVLHHSEFTETELVSDSNVGEIKWNLQDDNRCRKGFQNVPGTSGIMLNRLGTKQICAQFTKPDHLSYAINADAKCKKDMKSCGRLTENYFCIPKDLTCPVNGIRIQKGLATFENRQQYQSHDLGEDFHLYYTKDNTEGFLITDDWIIGGAKGVCLNPFEIEIEPEANKWDFWENHYLPSCQSRLDDTLYDLDYQLLFKISWKQILKNNNFEDFVKKHNLQWTETAQQDRQIGVYHKSKMFFNEQCKDPESDYVDTLLQFGKAVDYENIFILLTVAIVLNSCAIILLVVQLVIGILLKKGRCIRNYTINWKMLVRSVGSVALFDFLMISLLVVVLVLINKNKNYIYLQPKKENIQCADKNFSLFINFFIRKDYSILVLVILCLSIGIVSAFSYVVFYLIIIKNFDVSRNSEVRSNIALEKNKNANPISAEKISSNSRHSQRSKEEVYKHYSKIMFSGQYVSKDEDSWGYSELGTTHLKEGPKKPVKEEAGFNFDKYIYIDEQLEINQERGQTHKDPVSQGGHSPKKNFWKDKGLEKVTEERSQDQTFKGGDKINERFVSNQSNEKDKGTIQLDENKTISNIETLVTGNFLRFNTLETISSSKQSSEEDKISNFGLQRFLKSNLGQGSSFNVIKNASDPNFDFTDNESFHLGNTSLNQTNMNYIQKNILNFSKEEISYCSDSNEQIKRQGNTDDEQ